MNELSPESPDDEPAGGDAKIRILLCTCPQSAAGDLARFLVEGRYAACVNIVPSVTSIYRWEGKVHEDAESLLIMKCAKKTAKAAMEVLVEKHPYDVPEVLILSVKSGNPDYLEWVRSSCEGGAKQGKTGQTDG